MMTTPFKQFISKLEKRCLQLGIPYRKIKPNQCSYCHYIPIKDLNTAKKLKGTPKSD